MVDARRPVGEADVRAKAMANLVDGGLSGQAAERVAAEVLDAAAPDVAALGRLLRAT